MRGFLEVDGLVGGLVRLFVGLGAKFRRGFGMGNSACAVSSPMTK